MSEKFKSLFLTFNRVTILCLVEPVTCAGLHEHAGPRCQPARPSSGHQVHPADDQGGFIPRDPMNQFTYAMN